MKQLLLFPAHKEPAAVADGRNPNRKSVRTHCEATDGITIMASSLDRLDDRLRCCIQMAPLGKSFLAVDEVGRPRPRCKPHGLIEPAMTRILQDPNQLFTKW